MTLLLCFRYGFDFLEHSYLYHVTRKDVKHNFSVYFYMLYLTMDTHFSWIISLLAFLPQLLVVVVFGVKYYKDITFCCFVQTFAFVTFNKVCTSQVMVGGGIWGFHPGSRVRHYGYVQTGSNEFLLNRPVNWIFRPNIMLLRELCHPNNSKQKTSARAFKHCN